MMTPNEEKDFIVQYFCREILKVYGNDGNPIEQAREKFGFPRLEPGELAGLRQVVGVREVTI